MKRAAICLLAGCTLAILGWLLLLHRAERSAPNAAPEASATDTADALLTLRPVPWSDTARQWSAQARRGWGPAPINPAPSVDALKRTASNALPNEAVVILKPGVSLAEIAAPLGGTVAGSLPLQNAYRLQFPDSNLAAAAREQLATDNRVSAVDLNYSVARPPAAQALESASTASTALKVVAADSGNQVIVGLVDTAVQSAGTEVSGFLLSPVSIASGTGNDATATTSSSTPTHGTCMAETIVQGLALLQQGQAGSSVRILPVDVFGNAESTSTYEIAQGICAAVAAGARIVNLSIAGEGDSTLLQQVIQDAHNQGVIFLSAAGNEPVASPTYPAAYPEVVAVTATDDAGTISSYANRGSFVDVGAPGTTIADYNGQAYQVTGTSVATALASGIAAAIAEKTGSSVTQAEQAVRLVLALQKQGSQ
jgi:hypothetical protein